MRDPRPIPPRPPPLLCHRYPSMEKLEAATARIGLVLKQDIGPHLVSPPKPVSGAIVWRHTM